uniref:hypothetical protein n=1 Tax=Methylobacterium oryzae TaxID=334852 RepID=UPI00155DDB23|nr:hypothetical protein [Methylobacterium oryzae]
MPDLLSSPYRDADAELVVSFVRWFDRWIVSPSLPFLLAVDYPQLSGRLVTPIVVRLVGGCGLSLSAHTTHLRRAILGQNPEKRMLRSHLGWPEMGSIADFRPTTGRVRIEAITMPI